jgi:hypothetical protein
LSASAGPTVQYQDRPEAKLRQFKEYFGDPICRLRS